MRPHHPGRRFVVALLISCSVTTIWALPIVAHLNSRVLGGPSDATSTIRDYWYAEHVQKTPFSLHHDSFIAAPEGVDVSPGVQVANGVQPAIIWLLKNRLGLVGAWNVFILGGMALTGACMWLFLDSLGVGGLASFFGAYAVGFSGYMIDKAYAGHGGLVQAWIFPLLMMSLLASRTRSSRLPPVLAGLLAAVAFYIHSYYGLFAAFLLGLFWLFSVLTDDKPDRWRLPTQRFVVELATLAAGVAPALVAMRLLPAAPGGGSRAVNQLQAFGARIPSYFVPTSWSPLGRLTPHSLEAYLSWSGEPSLFFGFSTIVLAIYFWRDRDTGSPMPFAARFAITLVGAAFLMSLPRLFHIVGPFALPMPSWFIGHATTVWRVYARFGLLVGIGLATLAAFGLAQLERTRGRVWALACIAVLMVELTPTVPAQAWDSSKLPASDAWLAAHPGGIVAIYPLAGDEPAALVLNGQEYYYQRFHGHPLFSAVVPSMAPLALALRTRSQYFNDPDTAAILAAEHVRYVVTRDDVYRQMDQQPPRLPADSFRLVAHVHNARIFRVTAAPVELNQYIATHEVSLAAAAGQQPPEDNFGAGFYGPEKFKYATPWRWMSQDAKIEIKPTAGISRLLFNTLAFSNGQPRTLRLIGPNGVILGQVNVSTGMNAFNIGPFPVQGGVSSTFTLEVSPGPQQLSAQDPRVASVYLNEPVFRPVLAETQAR